MAQTTVEYVIFALSAIVFLVLLPRVSRYIRDQATRATGFGLLIFCVGGFLGNMSVFSEVSVFKLVYAVPLVLAFLSPLLSERINPARAILAAPVGYIIALWAWLTGVNIAQNASVLGEGTLLIRLAPGLLWFALLAAKDRSPIDRRMLVAMITFGLTIPGLMVPFGPSSWRPCDDTKCGVFDGMLTGWYPSENFIGLQVAFIVLLHLVTFGLKRSLYVLPLAAIWLLATESRTSQYALMSALVVSVVLKVGPRILKTHPKRVDGLTKRLLLALVPLGFVAMGIYLAMVSERADFSGRGWVWQNAMTALQGREIAGLGLDTWDLYQETGRLPAHLGPHSIYVFLAFSGGIVALALFVLFVRQAMVLSLRREGALFPGLPIGVAFLVLGLLEVVWNPAAIDGFTWIPLALVLAKRTAPDSIEIRHREMSHQTSSPHRKIA